MTMFKTTSITKDITLPSLLLLLAEVVLFGVLAVYSSGHFGMADGARITAAYLVAYLVPRIILSRARGTSIAACVILLLLAALLMAADYTNLLEWTKPDGYSLELPNLQGDARKYYKCALAYYDQRFSAPEVVFPGFPLIMASLWKVFGLSVIWPQALNLLFTLTSVVLMGMTTRRLLVHRVSLSDQILLSGGILLSCMLAFYLINGICILKEASTYLSITLVGYTLSSLSSTEKEHHFLWRDFLLFVLACALMSLIRTTSLYFIALGVIVMMVPNWRRDWVKALLLLAIVIVAFIIGEHYSADTLGRQVQIIGGGWHMQRVFVDNHDIYRALYNKIIGYYFLYSPIHKIALLPLTLSIQFIIPFPWMSYEDPTFANYICRISYGWYLVGGIALFYYIFMWWHQNGNMGGWPLWPAISYVIVTYTMAGSMTRYIAPIEPLFVPVALFVLARLYEGFWRKSFKRWMLFFIALIVVILLVCLEIQLSTFSNALHTKSLLQYLQQTYPVLFR